MAEITNDTLDALRERMIDGINELLVVAKRRSKQNAALGAAMLMSAAAALIREREDYLLGAEISFDYMEELLELQDELRKSWPANYRN